MSRLLNLRTADFESFRPEKRMHGRFFSLSIAPLAGGAPRVACVVSKKTAPRAVDRNRIKRRCREALRAASIAQIPKAYVFSAKQSAKDANFKDIAKDVSALLKGILA